jgi:hypothetical protein
MRKNSIPGNCCNGCQTEDQGDECAEARRQHHPGQQQRGMVACQQPSPQARRQRQRQQAAEKGQARHPRPRQPRRHPQQGEQAGAAGNAEQVGLGQRVAEQGLHQGPGHRQQSAAGESRRHARAAQLGEDLPGQLAVVRQRAGEQPEGDRQQRGQDQQGEFQPVRQSIHHRPTPAGQAGRSITAVLGLAAGSR